MPFSDIVGHERQLNSPISNVDLGRYTENGEDKLIQPKKIGLKIVQYFSKTE